ncbi:MAG: Ig domain-containing protein [Solirubrobacteraceae bacterium]
MKAVSLRARRFAVAGLIGAVTLAGAGSAGAATAAPVWSSAQTYGSPIAEPGAAIPMFTSISCARAGDCVAVGSAVVLGGSVQKPVIAAESSGNWGPVATVAAPPTSSGPITLTSVSCLSASSCVAVGYAPSAGATAAITVPISVSGSTVSAGSASTVTLPADADSSQASTLNGVSCTSSGGCVAVGSYTAGSDDVLPIVAVPGAGGAWTATAVTTTPPEATSPTVLNAISCPASGDCEAVGTFTDSSGDLDPWAVQVSGASAGAGQAVTPPSNWTPRGASGPSLGLPAIAVDALDAVSCPVAGSCTAAGSYATGGAVGPMEAYVVPIASGTPGKAVALSSASGLPAEAFLDGIWCSDPTDCVVAGDALAALPSVFGEGLVGSESGGAWSGLGLLLPGSGGYDTGILTAMTCASVQACTAAGFEAQGTSPDSTVSTFFADSAAPLSAVTSSLPAATVGVPYSAALQTAGGSGLDIWTMPLGSLPQGLSLNPLTGVISGTPTSAGQSGFVVDVISVGPPLQLALASLSITVEPAPSAHSRAVAASVAIAYLKTSGDRVTVVLTCSGARCTGKLRARGIERFKGRSATSVAASAGSKSGHRRHGRTKAITLATGRYSIAAGRSRVITLKLSRTARRLLSELHRISAYLDVTPARAKRPAVIRKLTFRSHGASR